MKYYSVIELKDFKSINRIGYLSNIERSNNSNDEIKITIACKIDDALAFRDKSSYSCGSGDFKSANDLMHGVTEECDVTHTVSFENEVAGFRSIIDLMRAITKSFALKPILVDVIDYDSTDLIG